MDELVLEGKTKTGELDFKMAAAACYLPVAMINVLASVVFLATEPKEHRFVRFHAVQSLVLALVSFVGSMGLVVGGMMVLPLVIMVFGGALGSVLPSDLADMVFGVLSLLAGLSYVVGGLGGMLVALAYPAVSLLMLFMVFTGKHLRLPLLGGIATRFA
ncbi:MAG: hypothetical protein R3F59_02295 [Myxococcota bacterium]